MEKKKKISESDVKRYLALQRIAKEVDTEVEVLKRAFLAVVPADGYRLVGSYQVCHKTAQRKVIKWKDEYAKDLGNDAVNVVTDEAPLGAISHSIKIEVRREMIDAMRKKSKVPDHIPDEQVGDYVIITKQKLEKGVKDG